MIDMKPRKEMPRRAPLALAQELRKYIEGKDLYELGADAGDLLAEMSRHAKSVRGITIEIDDAKKSRSRGLDVFHGDYFIHTIPLAEVYYAYANFRHYPRMLSMLMSRSDFNGIVILSAQQIPEVDKIKELQHTYGGSIHSMDYNEGSDYRCNGTWYYLVISASEWRKGQPA